MTLGMGTTTINNRGGAGEIETFAMANCLMLLSSQSGFDTAVGSDPTRMFSCKTCGRKFPSFQALGGHRASHNKNKQAAGGELQDGKSPAPAKPKTHACSICGLEFPIGQALGGHMRRHRAVLSGGGASVSSTVTSEGSVGKSDGGDDVSKKRKNDGVVVLPVLKKANSSKRICVSLDLDLNFPPWKEEKEKVVINDNHDGIEEGEIVQEEAEDNKKHQEEQSDFLKLELRQPIHCSL